MFLTYMRREFLNLGLRLFHQTNKGIMYFFVEGSSNAVEPITTKLTIDLKFFLSVMEDGTFAEQQMLKYGWSEGEFH